MFVSLNGEFFKKESATVPALQSGFFYGTGCFETIRAESGNLLFFDEHYDRLRAGLRYLGADETDVSDQQTQLNRSKELLRLNGVDEEVAKVRIQCTLAEQNGYAYDQHAELYTLITADKMHHTNKPKILTVANTRVVPEGCRPSDLKLCNMLHYRNAYREAQNVGADDSVMLTIDGYVSETSIANLFWKTGDKFYTPSRTCDLLPGITRNNIIQSIHSRPEYKLTEGMFELDHLMAADSVWVTNSLVEIHPVEYINQQKFLVDEELTKNLLSVYQSVKKAF